MKNFPTSTLDILDYCHRLWVYMLFHRWWAYTPFHSLWVYTPFHRLWVYTPFHSLWVYTPFHRLWVYTPFHRLWVYTPFHRLWVYTPFHFTGCEFTQTHNLVRSAHDLILGYTCFIYHLSTWSLRTPKYLKAPIPIDRFHSQYGFKFNVLQIFRCLS